LKFQQQKLGGVVTQRMAAWADKVLRSTLSSDVKRTIAGLFPRLRVWFENLDEARIDWKQTAAFVNEAYRSSPAVWLNGAMTNGNGEAIELRQRVEKALTSLVDPVTGKRVIGRCYRPDEIYDGPHAERAPSLLPSWWEDGFLLEQSDPGRSAHPNVERCRAPLQGGVEFAGSHRLDGVLIASGGPIRQGAAPVNARIIDIAPTVLHLMGVPIPSDMDGRVLSEVLDEDFVESNPIEWEKTETDSESEVPEDLHAFTEQESELIARRLQALGYIS
jgi:predicted AlkP superfamily phosphohydrolase/phosphomutase